MILVVEVCNKIDLLSPESREILENRQKRDNNLVVISALSGQGIDTLLARIDEKLQEKGTLIQITIPTSEGEMLAWCYRQGVIVDRQDEGEEIHLTLRLTAEEKLKLIERFEFLSL